MKRVLLAALLGGLTIFVYTSLHHTVLPFATMGLDVLPEAQETVLLEAMKENVPHAGLYFYPGMNMDSPTEAEQEVWTQKHRTGPTGLLLYRPIGGEPMPAYMMTGEFVSNLLAALLLALVATALRGSYMKRALLLSLFGLFGWLSISISEWLWFSYPTETMLTQGIDIYLGALFAGFVVAKIVRVNKEPEVRAEAARTDALPE